MSDWSSISAIREWFPDEDGAWGVFGLERSDSEYRAGDGGALSGGGVEEETGAVWNNLEGGWFTNEP
ncbi:MAG: hypothetical protein VYC34_09145 [Planctomycetota bacterium]|nr:hypothetical protein [Planctomycetota bacterium]